MQVMINSRVDDFLVGMEQICWRDPFDSRMSSMLTLLKSPLIKNLIVSSYLDWTVCIVSIMCSIVSCFDKDLGDIRAA